MSTALLDVNVLIALFDSGHMDHDAAHDWFGALRRKPWATCATTINGCIRILSNPKYPTLDATPSDVARHLRTLCASANHMHLAEDVTLLDEQRFRLEYIVGPRQVTDVYLLGLAVRHGGRLVTFDRSIPLKAVAGAGSVHLEVLR